MFVNESDFAAVARRTDAKTAHEDLHIKEDLIRETTQNQWNSGSIFVERYEA
jgi:hypothetical protein